jgi:hypothetical protein
MEIPGLLSPKYKRKGKKDTGPASDRSSKDDVSPRRRIQPIDAASREAKKKARSLLKGQKREKSERCVNLNRDAQC